MKMIKNIFLLLGLTFIVLPILAQVKNHFSELHFYTASINDKASEKIDIIRGTTTPVGPRSVQLIPILAYKTESTLHISILTNTTFNLRIENSSGFVIVDMIMTGPTSEPLNIDISSWQNDQYKILFVRSESEFYYGFFDL